jgi:hypothetical protein
MTGPPEAVQTVVVGVDGSEGSKRRCAGRSRKRGCAEPS